MNAARITGTEYRAKAILSLRSIEVALSNEAFARLFFSELDRVRQHNISILYVGDILTWLRQYISQQPFYTSFLDQLLHAIAGFQDAGLVETHELSPRLKRDKHNLYDVEDAISLRQRIYLLKFFGIEDFTEFSDSSFKEIFNEMPEIIDIQDLIAITPSTAPQSLADIQSDDPHRDNMNLALLNDAPQARQSEEETLANSHLEVELVLLPIFQIFAVLAMLAGQLRVNNIWVANFTTGFKVPSNILGSLLDLKANGTEPVQIVLSAQPSNFWAQPQLPTREDAAIDLEVLFADRALPRPFMADPGVSDNPYPNIVPALPIIAPIHNEPRLPNQEFLVSVNPGVQPDKITVELRPIANLPENPNSPIPNPPFINKPNTQPTSQPIVEVPAVAPIVEIPLDSPGLEVPVELPIVEKPVIVEIPELPVAPTPTIPTDPSGPAIPQPNPPIVPTPIVPTPPEPIIPTPPDPIILPTPKPIVVGIDASELPDPIVIPTNGNTIEITNFTGVGRGSNPDPKLIPQIDTLWFMGSGLTAQYLQLEQQNQDVVITFEGNDLVKVILKNIALDTIDNLDPATGASALVGNILFDGDKKIHDRFDVFNSDWYRNTLLNLNTTTFLNDLDNFVYGFDNSDDTINGQGGDDILFGLSGNDLLRGGSGDDILFGGLGHNQLVGNAGQDIFMLTLGGFSDVMDFTVDQDKISLPQDVSYSSLHFDSCRGGTQIIINQQRVANIRGIAPNQLTSDQFVSWDDKSRWP